MKRLAAALLLGFSIVLIVAGMTGDIWWLSFIGGMSAYWYTAMVWRD